MATDSKTGQPIFATHGVGLRNVGSYQVAGHPFITGSTIATAKVQMVEFHYVANKFMVVNQTDAADGLWIKVHFQSGSNVTAITKAGPTGEQTIASDADVILKKHYVTLSGSGDSVSFNSRCTKLYISNLCGSSVEYEVIADLTLIPAAKMYHLTGSGITE